MRTKPGTAEQAFETLLAQLPEVARDEFRRRMAGGGPAPCSFAQMFEAVHGWAVSAGIAEGRGGYPGRRGTPGWTDYVETQRRYLAIYDALVEVAGGPPPAIAKSFEACRRAFPAPVRCMGDGYEPHVDDVAGRLIYALPVDSSFVSVSFAFEIQKRDLDVLLGHPRRRALLEVIAHTVLQRAMIRGNPEVTQVDFTAIVEAVLHAAPDALDAFVAGIDRDHNISVGYYADAAMARRPLSRGVQARP